MTASEQRVSRESNLPLDARLRAWTAFCLSLVRPLLLLLAFMTLHRFLIWFVDPAPFVLAEAKDLAPAFFAGARFDLLVLGFFLIPVVLAGSVIFVGGWRLERAMSFFLRYLAGAWALVCGLAAVDLLFFCVSARRMTLIDVQQGTEFLESAWQQQGAGIAVLVLAIVGCTWILGARELLAERRTVPAASVSENMWKKAGRMAGPFFIVALMARGTVTAHHLERAHSEVSAIPAVNELALNAVWCFDKKPANR